MTLPRWTPSFGRHPPAGIVIPVVEAILPRIGINNAPDGAMLGRHLGLDPAPGVSVARNDDCPLHRNSQPVELLVVFAMP